jgi:hypothetical protein
MRSDQMVFLRGVPRIRLPAPPSIPRDRPAGTRMTAPELPREVLALVHGPVGTIAHVEMLLALRAAAPASLSTERVATAARMASLSGGRCILQELEAAGLVAAHGEDGWLCAPRDDGLREAVALLATMYNERPVTLVRALYERPSRSGHAPVDVPRLRHPE